MWKTYLVLSLDGNKSTIRFDLIVMLQSDVKLKPPLLPDLILVPLHFGSHLIEQDSCSAYTNRLSHGCNRQTTTTLPSVSHSFYSDHLLRSVLTASSSSWSDSGASSTLRQSSFDGARLVLRLHQQTIVIILLRHPLTFWPVVGCRSRRSNSIP